METYHASDGKINRNARPLISNKNCKQDNM